MKFSCSRSGPKRLKLSCLRVSNVSAVQKLSTWTRSIVKSRAEHTKHLLETGAKILSGEGQGPIRHRSESLESQDCSVFPTESEVPTIFYSSDFDHGPRSYVCQAPNAFICASPNAFFCVSPNAFAESATQRSSLRSLTFVRFVRTFFDSLNFV